MQKDPKNFGYEAERLFYDYIKATNIFKTVKHETDLKKLHGWDVTSIDYLLESQNGLIPVQIKYRGTRRRENSGVQNFLKSIEKVSRLYEKPILFGIWISRLRPFDDNHDLLSLHNIACVDEFHNMQHLMEKSVNYILQRV